MPTTNHRTEHLFLVEAYDGTDDKDIAWLSSALSDSQAIAEELARNAVDDQLDGHTKITKTRYLGVIDRDTFFRVC